LQALLTHSINGELILSFPSAFGASALASKDFCGADFVCDKTGAAGAAGTLAFSRPRFP
jgi:hypothetical protein